MAQMEQPITLVDDHHGNASYLFRRHLQDCREETHSYFGRLIADDRPASELISSDWTMMNDALARHYGYSGVRDGHLRKVRLRPDDKRGGGIIPCRNPIHAYLDGGKLGHLPRCLDGQAYPRRSSSVASAVEVPELDPTAGDNKHKTTRELMIQHREDPRCNVCHTKLDGSALPFRISI